jgi:formylglycine-generating enzyme required for sulfatase activity
VSRTIPQIAVPVATGRAISASLLVVVLAVSCKRVDQASPTDGSLPVITTKSGIEMVAIPAGRFRMGSSLGKPDQAPVHEVQLDAFLMDRYEMTQAHYAQFVPINGSHFKGPDNPVEMIAWPEAALFCNKRSRAEGLQPCYDEESGVCNFQADGYRLPTEAEWEYACRAGTDAEYSFGNDAAQLKPYAWCAENAQKKTHPVGQKKPNAWGLYDMYGNVAEWCNDVYHKDAYRDSTGQNPRGPGDGSQRVLRGGAWNSPADGCRSAYRLGENPGFEDACFARDAIGFRCVRRMPSVSQSEQATPSSDK